MQSAVMFLSKPILYKNGNLAGACREVAFSARLDKWTGLVLYDGEGRRCFLPSRFVAEVGEEAILLKTGALLSRPSGSFPLGKQVFSATGQLLSRVEDVLFDEERNVTRVVLSSGERISPLRVAKNAPSGVTLTPEGVLISPPALKKRGRKPQSAHESVAQNPASAPPKKAANAPKNADLREESTPAQTEVRFLSEEEFSPQSEEISAIAASAVWKNEQIPSENVVPAGAPSETAPALIETAPSPSETAPAPDLSETPSALWEAAPPPIAQPSTPNGAKAAPLLLRTAPANDRMQLPERVVDGRLFVGRILRRDMSLPGGKVLKKGEPVTPSAVEFARRHGLLLALTKNSFPAGI